MMQRDRQHLGRHRHFEVQRFAAVTQHHRQPRNIVV
jgi:hypothetical protein